MPSCEWEEITGVECTEDSQTTVGFLTIGPHFVRFEGRDIRLCTKHYDEYQEDHK